MKRLTMIVFAGLSALTVDAADWRATREEIGKVPMWMVELTRPVDSNEVVVAKVPLDMKLFLLVGQSNMSGRGTVGADATKPISRCFKLNPAGKWVVTTTPIHYDRPSCGYGPVNSFVCRYLDEHPSDVVGLVPCAVGGSHSITWSPEVGPDPVGTNFRRALSQAKIAQKNGKIIGILWHQGEADITCFPDDPTLKDRYSARLGEMARVFRAELKCPDAPFLVGEIGTLPQDCTAMNPILAVAAAAIPNACLVKASDLTGHMPDGIHFDVPSYGILGIRYYEAWKRLTGDRQPARPE